jgi:hypothetical protein
MLGANSGPEPRRQRSETPKKRGAGKSGPLNLERAQPPVVKNTATSERVVKALVSSKLAEAEATRRVQKAAAIEIELRNVIRKKDERLRTLEVNIKNFERILKLHGVTDVYTGGSS